MGGSIERRSDWLDHLGFTTVQPSFLTALIAPLLSLNEDLGRIAAGTT